MKTGSVVFYVVGIIFFAVAVLNASKAPNTQYLVGSFLPGLVCIIIGLSLGKNKKPEADALTSDEIPEVIPVDDDPFQTLLQANRKRASFFKLNANLGILGGIALLFLAGIFAQAQAEEGGFPTAWVISLAGLAWIIWGCVSYMRWKGYSGWFGFLGYLFLLGLVILVFFPNRRRRLLQKQEPKDIRQVEALTQQDRMPGFQYLLTLIPIGVFAVFFGFFLFFLRSDIKAADWQPFAPEGMGFQVLMPGTPELEEKIQETPAGPIELRKYTVWSRGKKEFFMVVSIRYPEEVSRNLGGTKRTLELGRQDVLAATKGQIKSQRSIMISGRTGLELELLPPTNHTSRVRVVATENQVHQANATVSRIRSNSDDVQKFLDSFQLTSKPVIAPEF
jgi:hypothetical protein